MSIIKGTRIVKRILSLVLALCIVLALFPNTALAANTISWVGTEIGASSYFGGFDHKVTITVNLDNITAEVYFERDLRVRQDRIDIEDEEDQETLNSTFSKLKANSFGKLTGKVTVGTISRTDLRPTYRITDFQWSGEPYIWDWSGGVYSGKLNNVEGYILVESQGSARIGYSKDGENYIEDVTLKRTETIVTPQDPEVEKYIFGEDSFSFANIASNFFIKASNDTAGPGLTYSASNGYQLSPKYYKMLIDGLSSSEIAAINSMMNNEFFGNCFGMSAVSALL